METFRVTPEDKFSSFGCYHVTPESPDGQHIAYVKWKEVPHSRLGGDAVLCLCNNQFQQHEEVFDIRNLIVHNGGGLAWIDNDHVQISNAWDGKIAGACIINVKTSRIAAGPYPKGTVLHAPCNRKVLMWVNDKKARQGCGVFCLDLNRQDIVKICRTEDFVPWTAQMIRETDNPADWHIDHATWSPDGTKVAINIDAEFCKGWHNYLWTMNADGANKIFFGLKPIHFEWYDNQSIWGNDKNVPGRFPHDGSLRRWDLKGNWIENLAGGECNHGAMSPLRDCFAGETWYGASPVELSLYKRGASKPKEIIMNHQFIDVTWALEAHVNPSFSADGKRIYFNKAVSNELNEGWCAILG